MTDQLPTQDVLARRLRYAARLAAVGKVASGAAHELNQPLNVIRMAAFNLKRAIEKDRFDPTSALEKLARIDEQIERAARLTGGMKAFSPTAQQTKVPVQPSGQVAVALELLAKRLSSVDATLEYLPSTAVCEVHADPTAIQELVFNLVDNAVEAYARQGPHHVDVFGGDTLAGDSRVIHVSEQVDHSSFELRITDHAGGIEPAELDALRAPFATSFTDDTHPGLGLAICETIAADLGGSLVIASDAGTTTVTVALPVQVSPA